MVGLLCIQYLDSIKLHVLSCFPRLLDCAVQCLFLEGDELVDVGGKCGEFLFFVVCPEF